MFVDSKWSHRWNPLLWPQSALMEWWGTAVYLSWDTGRNWIPICHSSEECGNRCAVGQETFFSLLLFQMRLTSNRQLPLTGGRGGCLFVHSRKSTIKQTWNFRLPWTNLVIKKALFLQWGSWTETSVVHTTKTRGSALHTVLPFYSQMA